MNDLRQTNNYAQYLKSIGWIVEKTNSDCLFIRRIPLTPFSIIKFQRPSRIDFEKIDQLAKKYHALAIYIEPLNTTIGNWQSEIGNYHLSKSPFLPTKTIKFELTKPEKEIFNQMSKDARYEIRKAQKADITISKYDDIQKFHQLWKRAVGWNRYVPSLKNLIGLKKSFGPKAIFLTATQTKYTSDSGEATTSTPPRWNGITKHPLDEISRIVAGTVILIADRIVYYYYAFTSKQGRQKSAQYQLVWEAIKLAKKRGCRIFDFEGIYDERFPIKSWKGFTHFKKSFGGKEVEYPGCFVKYQIPY